jgi:hypothetical protein
MSTQPGNEPASSRDPAAPFRERRATKTDRRALTLRTLLTSSFKPRRRGGRRADEQESPVDFHEPYLLSLAVAMLVLSVVDGLLTVTLMTDGATETNPLLAFVLDEHPRLFAAVKMGLTGLGVVLLVATARARLFKRVRTSAFLKGLVLAYFALVVYEAWLVSTMA